MSTRQIYMKNFANLKNLNYLRENYDKYNISFKKEQRNIIFLDIDGVIQPYSSKKRFQYEPEPLIEYLCKKTNNDIYRKIDSYDLRATYYDWDEISIGYIIKIARRGNATIVLESDWRSKGYEVMKALFAIYGMEDLFVDQIDSSLDKATGIRKYLEEHKGEYDNYVIIDDGNFFREDKELEEHLVLTDNYFTDLDYFKALHIIDGRSVFQYEVNSNDFCLLREDRQQSYFKVEESMLEQIEEKELIELKREKTDDKEIIILFKIEKYYGKEAEKYFEQAIKPYEYEETYFFIFKKEEKEEIPKKYGILKAETYIYNRREYVL